MSVTSRVGELRPEVSELARRAVSSSELMQKLCALLHDRMLKYNWVGFYMIDGSENPPMLALEAFVGAMTPHTRIPLNQGICGAAASSGQTIVVDDVSKDPRYLACSLETKSEIVVPIFARGKVVGELDIDSHFRAAFSVEDKEFLEHCAAVVGTNLESSPK